MTRQSSGVHAGSGLLRPTLRITGALVVLFFLTTPLATAGVITHDSALGRRVLWGPDGNEYLIMLAVINIVLGAYLFWSARNPSRYWLAIDNFLVAEAVHMGSMVVIALSPAHHMHWLGDVTGPAVGLIVLAAVWLPRRSAVIAAGNR